MRISDWSSDVCSSDLPHHVGTEKHLVLLVDDHAVGTAALLIEFVEYILQNVRRAEHRHAAQAQFGVASVMSHDADDTDLSARIAVQRTNQDVGPIGIPQEQRLRSEEHTSALQSL